MINAQKVFKKILRQWGHDILFQRRLSDDFVYDTEMQRYTTRSHLPKKFALATAAEEYPEGALVNSDLLYYFESTVNPKPGDRIYEGSFNPLEPIMMYLIDDSYPVRGRHGEVTYWIVGATKEVPS
jgi:hypothetical protein